MSDARSVTFLIGQLKAGDGQAVQQLWERYYGRLVGLARMKLRGAQRRIADEEDVALSAFDSFCRGAENNRFPRLGDRDDLWQLLMVVTIRKAIDLRQHEARKKRGGGAAPVGGNSQSDALDQVEGREPSPEFAAQVADECQRLLTRLDDPELRQIAVWKMEGYTNEEIASRMSCVERTVERKLKLIRVLAWSQADEM
jgi:DNA-directed RNA polymerase specialized sigma24 family protein